MDFADVASALERLEKTPSRLDMTEIVSALLLQSGSDLRPVALFVQGRVFPPWDARELGIAQKSMTKSIAAATGMPASMVEDAIAELGDTGLAAERMFRKKVQTTLGQKSMSLAEMSALFERLAAMEGTGSQDKKNKYVVDLLNSVSPGEVKYLVRLLLGEMRIGVGEGIVRDAVSRAFNVPAEDAERAFSLINDYSEVAEIARKEGVNGLRKISIMLFRPLRPMLAQSVHSTREAIENSCILFQPKYDGLRMQAHIKDGEIRIFTRRLDDVTLQFPDVVGSIRKAIGVQEAIIEGETVAVDENGRPRPFQSLSRRIKRKYDIAEISREIPVVTYLFDCMYLNGGNLVPRTMKQRLERLNSIITESKQLRLAETLITDDTNEAEKFYKESLRLGHEGVMCKNLDAPYKPGSRVGYMYKLKPVTETLDLAIIGAEWGEGRRAQWLGSYLLACRDQDTNEFLEIGRMGTGISDEQLKAFTESFKGDVEFQKGKFVKLRPRTVVEVGYQDLQKSPTYSSGYALRFPKLIRIREDRDPEECDTLDRVASVHERFSVKN